MKKRKFNTFTRGEIIALFGLSSENEGINIRDWTSTKIPLEGEEANELEALRKLILRKIASWNEEEYKARFTGPLMNMVRFEEIKGVDLFYERPLSVTLEDLSLYGTADVLVATDKGDAPEVPFFFLQELKKERGSSNDPEGQLIAEMVTAQLLNNLGSQPLYGSFTLGRFWFFARLVEKQYSVSQGFEVAQKEDLAQIFRILKQMKEYIRKMAA